MLSNRCTETTRSLHLQAPWTADVIIFKSKTKKKSLKAKQIKYRKSSKYKLDTHFLDTIHGAHGYRRRGYLGVAIFLRVEM